MKTLISRVLCLAMVCSLLATVPVYADATTGSITVTNAVGTGICIAGVEFELYQIFEGERDSATDFTVTSAFEGFFSGTAVKGGDDTYFDFDTAKTKDEAAQALANGVEGATGDYNDLGLYAYTVSLYIDTFNNTGNMALLADAIRSYVTVNGVSPTVTAEAIPDHVDSSDHNEAASETTTIYNLNPGYYFVMNPNSTINGIGVAADGAFAMVTAGENIEITVKTTVPVVEKEIFHDDLNDWDVVGDHQIGDTASFRITSSLPADISSYSYYLYILTDEMSDGISYNGDVAVYTDADCTVPLSASYLNIFEYDPTDGYAAATNYFAALDAKLLAEEGQSGTMATGWVPTSDTIFIIAVDVWQLMADAETYGTEVPDNLYTTYTGTVTPDALVSNSLNTGFEQNKITLTYSNNPHHWGDYASDEDTVFSFTFDLDVTKVDDSNLPLTGVVFTLYDYTMTQVYLHLGETVDGVDYYYPVTAEEAAELGIDGTITTNEAGKFNIAGLNDAHSYILEETTPLDGYNSIDPIQFTITATYNDLGTLTTLTSDRASFGVTKDGASTTIINRKTSILPDTGGIGTVVFYGIGGTLMLGAVVLLLFKSKKKSEEV